MSDEADRMHKRLDDIEWESSRVANERKSREGIERTVRGLLALSMYLPTALLGAYAGHKVWAWHLTGFLGEGPSIIEAWALLLLVSLARGYTPSDRDPLRVMVEFMALYALLLGVGWLLTLFA